MCSQFAAARVGETKKAGLKTKQKAPINSESFHGYMASLSEFPTGGLSNSDPKAYFSTQVQNNFHEKNARIKFYSVQFYFIFLKKCLWQIF